MNELMTHLNEHTLKELDAMSFVTHLNEHARSWGDRSTLLKVFDAMSFLTLLNEHAKVRDLDAVSFVTLFNEREADGIECSETVFKDLKAHRPCVQVLMYPSPRHAPCSRGKRSCRSFKRRSLLSPNPSSGSNVQQNDASNMQVQVGPLSGDVLVGISPTQVEGTLGNTITECEDTLPATHAVAANVQVPAPRMPHMQVQWGVASCGTRIYTSGCNVWASCLGNEPSIFAGRLGVWIKGKSPHDQTHRQIQACFNGEDVVLHRFQYRRMKSVLPTFAACLALNARVYVLMRMMIDVLNVHARVSPSYIGVPAGPNLSVHA
eukprot:1152091-Pelagomonas_calceolata.AAC.12